MTAPEPTALRRLALKVLAQHSGPDAGATALAAAGRRTYDDLARVSTPLIGQVGVDALMRRALHLAGRRHPWLVESRDAGYPGEPTADVLVKLEHQDPAVATEGAAAVFATFLELLVTFIGEPLTMHLLRRAWPGAFSDASAEET
jgi:hypothetical protein